MNDVIGSIDLISGIILKLSASGALLTFLWASWFISRPTSSSAVVTRVTKGDTCTGTLGSLKVVDPPQVSAPENLKLNEVKTPEPAVCESVECGNCHKEIKTGPITSMVIDETTWAIYMCEHCSVQVKLPLSN